MEEESFDKPESVELSEDPRLLFKRAQEHESNKNYDKAIEHYLKLSQIEPNNTDYLFKLGHLYSYQGDLKNAEKYFLQCLALAPEYVDARVGLAYVYNRMGMHDEAINQFQIVIKDDPKSISGWLGLARVYQQTGQTDQANAYYTKVLEIDPDNMQARQVRAKERLFNYQYKDAFEDYSSLYNYTKGGSSNYYNEVAYLRPYVFPRIYGYGSYSREEEEDLVTKLLTTRINSLLSFAELAIPMGDHLRFSMQYGNVPIRQINLLASINNYNINSPYGLARLEAYYRGFSFDGSMRLKWGEDKKSTPNNIFPFVNVRLWEPTFQFKYLSDNHYAIFTAYRDSFVARNFETINFSYFVKRTEIVPVYEYRFDYPYTGLGVRGLLGWYRGVYGNKKKEGEYWFRTQIPIIPESTANILIKYTGIYSSYQHVDPDYFSYRRQWVQKGKIGILKTWGAKGTVELSYTYLWQRDIDFVNIGEAIVTASPNPPETLNKNIFMANIFEFLAKMMIKTSLEMEASVKWYKNTNNYKTFSVSGAGSYTF